MQEISLEHLQAIEQDEPKRLILITDQNGETFSRTIHNETPREIAEYIRASYPGARYEEI